MSDKTLELSQLDPDVTDPSRLESFDLSASVVDNELLVTDSENVERSLGDFSLPAAEYTTDVSLLPEGNLQIDYRIGESIQTDPIVGDRSVPIYFEGTGMFKEVVDDEMRFEDLEITFPAKIIDGRISIDIRKLNPSSYSRFTESFQAQTVGRYFANTTNKRTLNRSKINNLGLTLNPSLGTVVLPAGTYFVKAGSMMYRASHARLNLYEYLTDELLLQGTSAFGGTTASISMSMIYISDVLILSEEKTVYIGSLSTTANHSNENGLGVGITPNYNCPWNDFSFLEIWRIDDE